MHTTFRYILLLALGFFSLQATVQAQHLRSKAGDLEMGAQLGLLSIYRIDNAKSIVPPVQLQGEYFVTENFSLGAFASYVEAEGEGIYVNGTVTEHYHNQTWAFGVRTSAYSNILADKWRIYGGIALGATLPQVETTVFTEGEPKDDGLRSARFSKTPTNSMLFTGFVGAQYYFNAYTSMTMEVGYGLSLVNVGIRYKLVK